MVSWSFFSDKYTSDKISTDPMEKKLKIRNIAKETNEINRTDVPNSSLEQKQEN